MPAAGAMIPRPISEGVSMLSVVFANSTADEVMVANAVDVSSAT